MFHFSPGRNAKGVFRLVSRRDQRLKAIKAAKDDRNSAILISPYASPWELRTFLRVDYNAAFKLLGVKYLQRKYFWQDEHGRTFQSVNKRNVMLSFPLLLDALAKANLHPKLVDPEPVWHKLPPYSKPMPVITVLGHAHHGKTTLIDTIANENLRSKEHGGITQNIKPRFLNIDNQTRLTLIDTPGQDVFQIMRGQASSLADAAILTVAADEITVQPQTIEALIRTAKYNLPLLVVFTKADLAIDNTNLLELNKLRLLKKLGNLVDTGYIDDVQGQRLESAIRNAVVVSSVTGLGVSELKSAIVNQLVNTLPPLENIIIPSLSTTPYRSTERAALELIKKRVEALQDWEKESKPTGIGIVVDIEANCPRKGRSIHVILRQGGLTQGQYFVAGTHWGRARKIWSVETNFERETITVGPGNAIQVSGLDYEGEAAPDDLFIVLPRIFAWRLALYRRSVEKLSELQSGGEPMKIAWESDSFIENPRTVMGEVDDMYDWEQRPELARDVRGKSVSPEMSRIQQWGAEEDAGIFAHTSTDDFEAGLGRRIAQKNKKRLSAYEKSPQKDRFGIVIEDDDEEDDEEGEEEEEGERASSSASSIWMGSGEEEVDYLDPSDPGFDSREVHSISPLPVQPSTPRRRRRGHRSALNRPIEDTGDNHHEAAGSAYDKYRRDSTSGESDHLDDLTETEKLLLRTSGYADKQEDPLLKHTLQSQIVQERWDQAWEAKKRDAETQRRATVLEALEAEKLRRRVNLLPALTPQEEEEYITQRTRKLDLKDGLIPMPTAKELQEMHADVIPPLPGRGSPVIPVILRTAFQHSYGALLDELDRLQRELQVRTPVVHGGVGTVRPTDVNHALIEQHYGYCPIYAYQVQVLPSARQLAETQKVTIKSCQVFTEILEDIRRRCEEVLEIQAKKQRTAVLRRVPTKSGL